MNKSSVDISIDEIVLNEKNEPEEIIISKNKTSGKRKGGNCSCENKEPHIRAAWFILTENCNLRCKYCFEGQTRDISKYMSRDTAFKGIDFLFDQQKGLEKKEAINVSFFGGEPTLCTDLMLDMLDYGYKKSHETGIPIWFDMITNGTLWNDEIENFMNVWLRYTHTLDIQLSYDGTPAIQDKNRICACKGQLSSELIKETSKHYVKYYKKYGLDMRKLHTHCCLTNESIPHIFESYKYFREELGIENNNFAWVMSSPWTDDDLKEFDMQMNKLCEYMLLNGIKEFPFKHREEVTGCGCGRKMVGLDPDGNIFPCHRFYFFEEDKNKFIIGNVNDDRPISRPGIIERFKNINLEKVNTCGACQVCVAENYSMTKRLHQMANPKYDAKFMDIINFHYKAFKRFEKYLSVPDEILEAAKLIEKTNQ